MHTSTGFGQRWRSLAQDLASTPTGSNGKGSLKKTVRAPSAGRPVTSHVGCQEPFWRISGTRGAFFPCPLTWSFAEAQTRRSCTNAIRYPDFGAHGEEGYALG